MKILAIDTSTAVMGIALLEEDKVYAEITTNLKKNHSVRLMPMVDNLFKEVKWEPNDIDLVAVAKGPGSYTGVRIGVTTAKTFSFTLNKPLVGISTLEALAYPQHFFNGYISPIIDARRGQVYTGLYQWNDMFDVIEQDHIVLLTKWLEVLKASSQNVLFMGDDVQLHKEQIIEHLGEKAFFSIASHNIPRPSVIGYRAMLNYRSGIVDNNFDFAPSYLQLAEAEVKWLEKQKGE